MIKYTQLWGTFLKLMVSGFKESKPNEIRPNGEIQEIFSHFFFPLALPEKATRLHIMKFITYYKTNM